ncbi:zinc finger CCCH domain-containing protein 22-like [Sesamum indicum]|uniref:Zinc finger CCCH domain-containing protein 22-like n=1 Tax=Sesamum indicum TaxID=4182 RepID=A0A6I9THX8_SESIN|nr:zinc finger CCCH domain-containing protein 22-like [Sesamum indicum]XP_020550741.1 zinc finger CCCH domain-containing protein 22-like [Sesamum indicum]
MDTYEATKIVMSRIQNLDPENASRIMGYILIQDQGEKEMIRLAFSPEAHLLSYINQAKAGLGLLPSSSPSSNPSTPLSYPIRPNSSFPPNSPRIMIPNNGFHLSNPPSPAAPFQRSSPRPISYAAVLDGSVTNNGSNNGSGSPSLHFYGGNDDYLSGGVHHQVQEQLPFLDDSVVDPIMSPSGRSDSLVFPYGEDANGVPSPHPHPFHRRSCSVNDAAFLSNLEDGGGNGFLWRPCMYFARGFCKNGSTCKFLHSDVDSIDVGSPSKTGSGFDELLRMKALQNQRFAFMASGGHHPFAYNKCMDILNENPRGDLSPMGYGAGASSSSRQIYLTFPADSTFKEEDVSNYFSMFGPVQDVRIPYQQKRMFGFVTFVYPETVKLILAKGNPHFVCDSRVLVKPYKEKGKVREKKQQQQHLERGEYSACLSPSGVDSREPFDHLPFGSRMLFSPQEMMLRRKLEQEAELQHAIELQGRRMMNLQLMDLKNQNHNHHYLQSIQPGIPYSSPRQSRLLMNQHVTTSSDSINQEESEDACQEAVDEKLVTERTESFTNNRANADESDLEESLEHILPDNLFASPTKLAAEKHSVFSQASAPADDTTHVTITSSNNTPVLPTGSPLTIASLKSCYFQMPRFSSGQEAIEM